ncbi:hypothetical protein Tco_0930479, partial [Tanacetum coccineum]
IRRIELHVFVDAGKIRARIRVGVAKDGVEEISDKVSETAFGAEVSSTFREDKGSET